ncbi:acyl carrier protein [Streptomyces sp. CBMA123]|uniref:acyl carrier protein n=1 Tax=Streptomyces sp. CBMA123 TaxID=1896313 RepID=UPI001661D65C|nr:phosphopantetheine-binding protein [Streptomyces sp. CBMA123]
MIQDDSNTIGAIAGQAPALPVATLAVIDIWSDVLEVAPDSIDPESSDFFELGGYSLLALQAIGRLMATHGIDQDAALELEGLLLNELFEQPTAAAQAACFVTNFPR